MLKICKYFIISFLIFFFSHINVFSQNKKENLPKIKWWNGIMLNFDVVSPIQSSLSSSQNFSAVGNVQINLKDIFLPVYEIGIDGINKTSSQEIYYKANGIYQRAGIDFNLLRQKKEAEPSNNKLLGGIRVGWSNFKYDVTNITITDDYWGGESTLNYERQSASKVWYEIVFGIQVEVFKNVYLGWNIRSKNLFKQNTSTEVSPWYIPGFGKNNTSNVGFNYTVGYHF